MSHSTLDVHTNTCGLQTLIMNQHPKKIIPYLMSCKSFSEELAIAFAIGLDLGKHTEIIDEFRISLQKNTKNFQISSPKLLEIISDKVNWKLNHIEKLFDMNCLQKAPDLKEQGIDVQEVRNIFAECAVNDEAMIAVNVAILKWSVFGVHLKPC